MRSNLLLWLGVLLAVAMSVACGDDSSAPTEAARPSSTVPSTTSATTAVTSVPTAVRTTTASSGTEITLTGKLSGTFKPSRTECAAGGTLISFSFAMGVDVIQFAIKGGKTGENYVFPQSANGVGPVTVLLVQMEQPDFLAGFASAPGKGTIMVGNGSGTIDLDLTASGGAVTHVAGSWRCS